MKVSIVPITRENLDLVSVAGEKWGMPRSRGWLNRCMFDPIVEDMVVDPVRGHLAMRDDGEVVAAQGYYYLPAYFKQTKLLLNTGCIMGADAAHGADLIVCLEQNDATQSIFKQAVDNCLANEKSAKVVGMFNGMKEAPLQTRECRFAVADLTGSLIFMLRKRPRIPKRLINFVWRMLRPASWVCRNIQAFLRPKYGFKLVNYRSVDFAKFGDFWTRLLQQNDGLMTSRSPTRLAWLFSDSLRAKTVQLVAAERDGKICGYTIVRRLPYQPQWSFAEYCDICALNKDEKCLEVLAGAVLTVVSRDGGIRVSHYGALPGQDRWLNKSFKHCIVDNHPTFMYRANDKEIEASLQKGDGWFFGPFDGERCLGHGGFVDC